VRAGPCVTPAQQPSRPPTNRRRRPRCREIGSGIDMDFAARYAGAGNRESRRELNPIEISPSGSGTSLSPKVRCRSLFAVPVEGVFGSRRWMAARLPEPERGGRSSAKSTASRKNVGLAAGRENLRRMTGLPVSLSSRWRSSRFCTSSSWRLRSSISPPPEPRLFSLGRLIALPSLRLPPANGANIVNAFSNISMFRATWSPSGANGPAPERPGSCACEILLLRVSDRSKLRDNAAPSTACCRVETNELAQKCDRQRFWPALLPARR